MKNEQGEIIRTELMCNMKKAFTKSRIMGYILLLTMASLLVVSLSYARYSTQVSGTATATVAAWGSDYTSESKNTIDISGLVPGGSQVYRFKITNEKDGRLSEVAQSYSMTLETTGNLPLTFTLSVENPSDGKTLVTENTPLTLTDNKSVMDGGTLPPAVSTAHNYTLTINWPADKNGAIYSGEIDQVTLTVKAQQTVPVSH